MERSDMPIKPGRQLSSALMDSRRFSHPMPSGRGRLQQRGQLPLFQPAMAVQGL